MDADENIVAKPGSDATANGKIVNRFVIIIIFFIFVGLGLALWMYYDIVPRKISSSGGLYFFSRSVLPVPRFAQTDSRWSDALLGSTSASLGAEGCAVSSAAMVLSYYGVDVNPGWLNEFLSTHNGYTERGWLYWEKAADFFPGAACHVYEDLPSYYLIDSNLRRGNPVIVRIERPNGAMHFVVIVGKEGFDYLIQDPAPRGAEGVCLLRELAKQIEALRFYEPLSKKQVR